MKAGSLRSIRNAWRSIKIVNQLRVCEKFGNFNAKDAKLLRVRRVHENNSKLLFDLGIYFFAISALKINAESAQ
jgi:hypothetical protein